MSKPAKKQSPASSQIEVWALEDLKPYERNAREHPPEQVEKLARSITEFGFTIPLLVSEDGEIIAGHGRELAARSLGLAEVPVIVARGWPEERRRAYRIADNALALGSEWNDEFLRIELADLAADDFDVALTGLGEDDLSRLLAEAATEGQKAEAPVEFKAFDESIETEHQCPKCGYAWSGKAK